MLPDLNDIVLPDFPGRGFSNNILYDSKTLHIDGHNSVQINDGGLLVFDSTLSQQNVDDVSNSFLFAQLVANKKFDRNTEADKWRDSFFNTLSLVGWIISKNKTEKITTDSLINWVDLVSSYIPDNLLQMTKSSMDRCGSLPKESKAVTIWRGSALKDNDGVLIVAPSYFSNNTLNMSIVFIDFNFSGEFNGFLKWIYYDIDIISLGLELNESVYSKVRQNIISKLEGRPNYFVVDVPLK